MTKLIIIYLLTKQLLIMNILPSYEVRRYGDKLVLRCLSKNLEMGTVLVADKLISDCTIDQKLFFVLQQGDRKVLCWDADGMLNYHFATQYEQIGETVLFQEEEQSPWLLWPCPVNDPEVVGVPL